VSLQNDLLLLRPSRANKVVPVIVHCLARRWLPHVASWIYTSGATCPSILHMARYHPPA
jgi:hypothetical protein